MTTAMVTVQEYHPNSHPVRGRRVAEDLYQEINMVNGQSEFLTRAQVIERARERGGVTGEQLSELDQKLSEMAYAPIQHQPVRVVQH
jgi:hypothetical protein